MSQRVKRPNRTEDGSVPVKRRKRTTAEEEEATSLAATSTINSAATSGNANGAANAAWQPPRTNELKSIYNRTTTEAPAELFRKDLISAMKLPDSEQLATSEYWVIVDQWKQEWERGVQVPVNPDSLPEPLVTVKPSSSCSSSFRPPTDFKLHKMKYTRITKDENFKMDEHVLSQAPAKAEAACSYDLDECDVAWLKVFNAERAASGLGPIFEEELERVIERLELCCWEKIQSILRNEEGLGIEYDENVICDVCRSPDSEEGNEMVFCDSCNICVHQACYGITRIPDGQWLCCTCNIGKRPECVLCPNKGGAMKCLRTGQKWAHVSCALWIPEVSIGCVEKMEPITKVSSIPQSRWALICVLCRERVGACIQCSVKTCKTAYHVTCAFKHGLEMRAIIEDENADDVVKLRSYCEKHSKSNKKEKSICSGSEDDDCKRKKRKDMTSEEKNQARAIRLQEIEAEFFKHVSVKDISVTFTLDNDALMYIYNYWKLKRKAGYNKPLLPPKSEDVDVLSHKREQADVEKMKMFVQLRQDLERVRNLCYMVSRREKLSRSFFRMREQTFHKQTAVLDSHSSLPPSVIEAVIEANHGPSIYDRLYSHNEAEDHTDDFETILARIAGKSPGHSGDEHKIEVNGLFKDVKNNPYKKVYFNGSSKRRSLYGSSMSEQSSSDEKPKDNKENRLHTDTEDEKPSVSNLAKKKSSSLSRKPNNVNKVVERKQRKKHSTSKSAVDTSSEEDIKPSKKDWGQFSRSRLSQMDKELGDSASDSDELMMPITSLHKNDNHKTAAKSITSIYSDTESSDDSDKNDDKSSNATTDSQSKLRTKAAVKEFLHKPSKLNKNSNNAEVKKKSRVDEVRKETDTKKKDYVPSDLIVPQRQAAKKATENLKTTTISRTKEHSTTIEESSVKVEEKIKNKPKTKLGKENDVKESDVKEKPIKDKELAREEKSKDKEQFKEIKEKRKDKDKEKENKALEVFDIDKEIDKVELQELLYVPQRQAAKKAAEHIKSGLGKPVLQTNEVSPNQETVDKMKKEPEIKKIDPNKKSDIKKDADLTKPAKISESKRKSSTNSSSNSSSSTNSSSDSSSSSSSESEEPVDEKSSQQPRSESIKRSNAKDLPFLDKGARSAATFGSSSSSDSSPPSSPTKKPTSPQPVPISGTDSPSRAANELSTKSRKSPDKKQSSATSKREEQQQSRPSRGRGRAPRGRPKTSNSGERLGDANVRNRDMSDGKRVGLEGEPRTSKGRKGKTTSRDNVDEKETTDTTLLSPVHKTYKKIKDDKTSDMCTLQKEILERKLDKEGAVTKSKSSMFERLFGTPEKKEEKSEKTENSDKVEKLEKVKKDLSKIIEKPVKSERPLIAPEKLTIPDKNNVDKSKVVTDKSNKPTEATKKTEDKLLPSTSPSKLKLDDTPKTSLPDLSIEKSIKTESLIKSPNKELKEQVDKKMEQKEDKKVVNKKPTNKNKSIEDIFANKLSNSETKENEIDIKKPPTPKQIKTTDEITLADKIVDDHLQIHKAKDLFRQSEVVQEAFTVTPDVAKTLLNDLETDKKNFIKPIGLTNQVLQNRSIFSPQPHVKDADFLDLVNFEDISKDDDLIKSTLSWNFNANNAIVREDTKEDSARETLNLVEKLRMGLSKKSGGNELDEPTTSETDPGMPFHQELPSESTNDDAKETPIIKLLPMPDIASVKEFPHANKDTHQDYNYLNNIPSNASKDIVQQNQSLTTHSAPVEGDERWVPPSDNYPDIQTVDQRFNLDPAVPSISNDTVIPSIVQNSVVPDYIEQYTNNNTDHQEHQKKQFNSLPAQLEARLQEEVLKSAPIIRNRVDARISQTPLGEPPVDSMNSPMPYSNIHPQAKWADCEVIPNRRSVSRSSSSSSSSSASSRRDEDESRLPDIRVVNHASLDMATSFLPGQAPPSYPPNPLDNFGGYSVPDGYPVSLFPPPNLNNQLPFPPTGPVPMYHPPAFGAPFPAPSHSMPPMSTAKPVEESSVTYSSTCTAAFTSSQHNMEFTAAMVNMPPAAAESKPIEQQLEEQLLGPPNLDIVPPPSLTPTTSADEIVPSPALSNTTSTANSTLPSPSTSLKSNSSVGKKSPSKPTRTSARVSSQMMNKSPAKSPGKSPRQEIALKQSGPGRGRTENKRASNKTGPNRGAGALRGRGRGRSRGRGNHNSDFDFVSAGTIHNNLVGTVYDLDFDDDNDNMADLKSMRERRKSLDFHERKYEPFSSTRDSPRSPKFSSPSQTSHKGRSYNTDLRELRPPTPIEDSRTKTDVSLVNSSNDPTRGFPDVTPPLPGPVDMRTYNTNFDQQTYNEQNLLSAFASGTAETQVQEIDEDFEKELHTALAKKPTEPPPPSSESSNNIKVSLSDSRNQLKVKIKGPIANYTSTVAPLPPLPTPVHYSSTPVAVNSSANNAMMNSAVTGMGSMSSGGGGVPSSLRRMRKKELLRQYWTQDMNMDDPTSNTGFATPAAPPVNRTIITIPKAVASMTSIPTKEDYRDYRTDSDDLLDSKHLRKESKSRPLSRELRQLDLVDNEGHLERRRSVGSSSGNNANLDSLANKRRGRPMRPSSQQLFQQPVTPKLKIKIGNNTNSIVGGSEHPPDKRDRIRPPKKRLAATQNKPSVEDLKRESMKFRKMMVKDLKIKHKKDKSEKKKKKKLKSEVQIIANTSENPTKLIIRFGKKSDSDNEKRTSGESDEIKPESCNKGSSDKPSIQSDDKDKQPPVKLIPIKLKLSRCQEGSGYVMKPPVQNTEKLEMAAEPGQPPPKDPEPMLIDMKPAADSSPPPLDPALPVLAVKKDCEVR